MTCASASRKFIVRVFGALCLLPLFLLPCSAQTTLGSIFGTITDSSGAVVPNATVTVTSVEQGTTRVTKTGTDGGFRVTELQPGTYRVSVVHQGFAKTQSAPIPLAIQAIVRADLAMKPGSNDVTVEVDAANPLLETGSAEISSQVTTEELHDLPSNDRNIVNLMSIGVGVTGGNYDPSSPNSGGRVGQITGGEVVSMGTPPVGNSFLLDGVTTNMEFSGTIAARPPMDMAAGFQTQVAQFPADEGRASGAILNMSIKAGTNKFHGSVYGYVQNSAVNAQPRNYTSLNTKPPFHRYQYGVNLGGPIIKDKLFFFAGYEGLRQLQTSISTFTVPAASERVPVSQYGQYNITPTNATAAAACNGYYFGATTDGNGGKFSGITTYNPTTVPYGVTTTNRTPFANNCIPLSSVSPTTQALLQLYPMPNNPSVSARSYAQSVPRQLNGDWETEKTNWTITPKDSIDMHFLRQNQFLQSTGLNPSITFSTLAQNGINSGVNYFRVISPTLLNVARIAYTRFYLFQITTNQNNFLGGVIPGWPTGVSALGPPTIAPASISTLGPLQLVTAFASPFRLKENNYQAQDMLTWQHGKHSFKFGGEYEQIRFWQNRGRSGGGNLSFNGSFTNQSPTGAVLADGVPDMLLGLASGVTANYMFTTNGIGLRTHYIMPFVQDDWRVMKNLTLNLGLRYDIFTPYHVEHDMTENFDPATGTVLIPSDATFPVTSYGFTTGLPAHWQYVPRDQVYKKISWKSFDPRIGFALQVNPRLVWRGGFGMYHIPVMGNTPLNGTTNTNDVAPSISQGAPFCLDVSQGGWCPTVGLPSDPTGGFKAALTSQGFVPFYYQRNLPDPYSEKFTTDINFTPTHNTSVDIGYLGANTQHFAEIYNINQAPNVSSTLSLVSRQPFPNFGTSLYNYGQVDHTNYNAGFVTFQLQKWHGLQFKAYYTYAKGLGIGTGNDQVLVSLYNPNYDYGPLDYDIRHRLVTTFIYRIPKPSHRLVGAIVGNWDLTGIVNLQTGLPFTVTTSGGSAITTNIGTNGGSGQRPYVLHNPVLPKNQRTVNRWFDTSAFANTIFCTGAPANSDTLDPNGYAIGDAGNPCRGVTAITAPSAQINKPSVNHIVAYQAATGPVPWGNEGKNPIYGPNEAVFTTALQRRFGVHKGYVTLRLEEYNLFNHPNYGTPGGLNLNVATPFGAITSSRTYPRQLTGSLRYDF